MPLRPEYVLTQDLDTYFVDQATGLPLAGGLVTFYHDNNRNTKKAVYELTGAPPNYTYTPLSNPIILGASGTISDSGNNIAVYYKPFDDAGNVDLYYVTVTSALGVPQFTRQGWPNTTVLQDPEDSNFNTVVNMISNPQFVDVNFNATTGLTISIPGIVVNQEYNIAPGWLLRITTTGASTILVARIAQTGSANIPTNPSYTLNVTPGVNVGAISLVQRLNNDSSTWSTSGGAGPIAGFVATSVTFNATLNTQITVNYAPSVGAVQTLLAATNTVGSYQTVNSTVQLNAAGNTQTADIAYIDIIILLSNVQVTSLTSIQCVASPNQNMVNVPYDEAPANRQRDFLAHYYRPLLQYKQIPSHLVGWDFPLNPANALGATVAASAIGANKSKYVWDQTIMFQSVDSSIGVSRGTFGQLTLTAALAGSTAIIQYLDAPSINKLVNDRMSVHIAASSSIAGLLGTVSLWTTTNGALPVVSTGTNNSLVTALDATGFPTVVAGWTQIPRNLGNATFNLSTSTVDIDLSGWAALNLGAVTNPFFAIVVGFAPLTLAATVSITSIALCSGDIATRPAPKTINDTINDCQRYFYSTFPTGTTPVTQFGVDTGYPQWNLISTTGGIDNILNLPYPVSMRVNPTVTLYNPVTNTNTIRDFTTGPADCPINTISPDSSARGAVIFARNGAGANMDRIGVHISADARLGIV